MTVYCILVDKKVQNEAYTSLKGACESAGVDYFKASRGCRVFEKKGVEIEICELDVRKILGRGKSGKRMFSN